MKKLSDLIKEDRLKHEKRAQCMKDFRDLALKHAKGAGEMEAWLLSAFLMGSKGIEPLEAACDRCNFRLVVDTRQAYASSPAQYQAHCASCGASSYVDCRLAFKLQIEWESVFKHVGGVGPFFGEY